jgi:hypothetical protein
VVSLSEVEENRFPVIVDPARQHSGAALACDYCSLTFSDPALLSQHLHSHEKYVCHVCGKKFIRFEAATCRKYLRFS